MKKTTESDLVRACIEYLTLKGVFCWRNNTGAFAGEHMGRKRFVRFGTPGAPDIMAIVRTRVSRQRQAVLVGRFLGVECKSPTGKQSAAQRVWQEQCERAGGAYFMVRRLGDLMDQWIATNERQ